MSSNSEPVKQEKPLVVLSKIIWNVVSAMWPLYIVPVAMAGYIIGRSDGSEQGFADGYKAKDEECALDWSYAPIVRQDLKDKVSPACRDRLQELLTDLND